MLDRVSASARQCREEVREFTNKMADLYCTNQQLRTFETKLTTDLNF